MTNETGVRVMGNETKHTATPWHTNLEFDGRHRYYPIMAPWAGCDDETNYHPLIAMTRHGTGDAPQEVARANASHIVKCVNLHDELVKALSIALTRDATGQALRDDERADMVALLAKVREA